MKKREIIKYLKAAKKLLVTAGWTQGTAFNDETGMYCALGAARKVTGGDPWYSNITGLHVLTALDAAARSTKRFRSIVTYNDKRGRTLKQVLGRFDRAIELVQNGKVK